MHFIDRDDLTLSFEFLKFIIAQKREQFLLWSLLRNVSQYVFLKVAKRTKKYQHPKCGVGNFFFVQSNQIELLFHRVKIARGYLDLISIVSIWEKFKSAWRREFFHFFF